MCNLTIINAFCNGTIVANEEKMELKPVTGWLSRSIEWLRDRLSGGKRSEAARNLIIKTLEAVPTDTIKKNLLTVMGSHILDSKLGKDQRIKKIIEERFGVSVTEGRV